jgi:F420-dependent oxidoreductase-like protein
MRIGLFIGDTTAGERTDVAGLLDAARWAERNGFTTGWVPHIPWSLDGLTAVALAGQVTSTMLLGTAVMPTYPRHPLALAHQAHSAQAAAGGRLVLGIGPSHPVVIERMHGLAYDSPAAHTREYIEVLRASMAGPLVTHHGERFDVEALLDVPGASPFPILVAALAPLMLRVAGEVADGTITYWADERALESHVLPRLTRAAVSAARPQPKVVVGLPVAVVATNEVDAARREAATMFEGYLGIPTYQRILGRGASTDPVDVAVIGDEAAVTARLRSYAGAGATDLAAALIGLGPAPGATRRRTAELLASLTPQL